MTNERGGMGQREKWEGQKICIVFTPPPPSQDGSLRLKGYDVNKTLLTSVLAANELLEH